MYNTVIRHLYTLWRDHPDKFKSPCDTIIVTTTLLTIFTVLYFTRGILIFTSRCVYVFCVNTSLLPQKCWSSDLFSDKLMHLNEGEIWHGTTGSPASLANPAACWRLNWLSTQCPKICEQWQFFDFSSIFLLIMLSQFSQFSLLYFPSALQPPNLLYSAPHLVHVHGLYM